MGAWFCVVLGDDAEIGESHTVAGDGTADHIVEDFGDPCVEGEGGDLRTRIGVNLVFVGLRVGHDVYCPQIRQMCSDGERVKFGAAVKYNRFAKKERMLRMKGGWGIFGMAM